MDLFEAIERRHSYRGAFTGKRVERKTLTAIVQAGIRAPSGCNAQTTSFVIVDDPDLIARIAAIMDKPSLTAAAAIVVCVTDPKPALRNLSFAVEDCAAAVENMLLAVTAFGLATVWLDGALRVERRAERLAELLGVPADRLVRVILPIGEPAAPCAQKEKQPFEQRAAFNRWPDSPL